YRTPDGVTDVPVGQPPQDRDAGWVRDLPGEARLLDTLVLPPGLPRLRATPPARGPEPVVELRRLDTAHLARVGLPRLREDNPELVVEVHGEDRKSTRLNSSHVKISYAVFCLKKKIKERSVC